MKALTIIFCVYSMLSMIACNSYSPREERVRSVHSIQSAPRAAEKYGRVTDIDVLTMESRSSGGGAVLGAVIGGVLGHQLGKGTGRDVATGAGALGGAIAGNSVEKRNGRENEIYRVTVKFENGSRQQFDYEDIDDLRVGDRVKIDDGVIERL